MAIRPLRSTDNSQGLPAAKLFLDDIRDIAVILQRNTPQNKSGQSASVYFEANDYRCDSLEELESIGGRTTSVVIGTFWAESSPYSASVKIDHFGTTCFLVLPEPNYSKAWKEIFTVFKSRSIWWKNALRSIPGWVFVSLLMGLSALQFLLLFIPQASRPMPRDSAFTVIGIFAVVCVVAYFTFFEHSVVQLAYSYHGHGLKGFLRRHGDQLTFGAVGAAIGTAVTILVQRLLR